MMRSDHFALRRRVPAVLTAASTTRLQCLNWLSSRVRLSLHGAVLKRDAALIHTAPYKLAGQLDLGTAGADCSGVCDISMLLHGTGDHQLWLVTRHRWERGGTTHVGRWW